MACLICDWYTPEVEDRIETAGIVYHQEIELIRQGRGFIGPPEAPDLARTGARWDHRLNGTR